MGENHFAYPWFEKCHLTYLRYVSVNLRNPPRSLPLQKHLLTPKQNIIRIKIPKNQKLFERGTWGEISLFFVVWSIWRRRKHLFCIIETRQGMCDCCSSRPTHVIRVFSKFYLLWWSGSRGWIHYRGATPRENGTT